MQILLETHIKDKLKAFDDFKNKQKHMKLMFFDK